MAFLDWIKNKAAPQQQGVAKTPQPETAKKMYLREATEEKVSGRQVEGLSEAQKGKAMAAAGPVLTLIEKATQHQVKTPGMEDSHSDGKGALMHNQSGVEKTQQPMSPTDGHKGRTHSQGRGRGMER